MKATTLQQAIEIGFDFEAFSKDSTLAEVEQAMIDFLNDNVDLLPEQEDECEVTTSGRYQNVNYGDFTSSGEIVDFAKHWGEPADTKVYHSNFLFIDKDGNAFNFRLYYLVGKTDYNQDNE